jgi:hypothetical protein
MSCVVMLAVERVPGFRSPMLRLAIGSLLATSGLLAASTVPAGAQVPSSSVTFQTNSGSTAFTGNGANLAETGSFTFTNPTGTVNPWTVLNLSPPSGGFFEGITALYYTTTPSLSYDDKDDPTFSFGSFYFLGSCSICGTTTTPGEIISIGPVQSGTVTLGGQPGQFNPLQANVGPVAINYGNTGHSGTVSFNATALVRNNESAFAVAGVNFTVFDGPPGVVPGPVPLFGAAAAFGYSRRLRRRVALSREILS